MKLKLLFFLIFGFLSNFLKSQEIEIRLGRQIKCPYDLEDVSTKVPRPMGPLPTDDEFRIRQSGNVSSALPTATFIVNYSGNVTQDAVDAFEYAINIWAHELVSPVPIEINLELDAFEGGFLAFANQNEARNFPNAPKVNRWYPTALANSLAGVDLAPESADIFISFATRTDWYYGTDGNPPSGFFDFVTIALHEIGHGLGMVAFRSLASDGSGFYTSGGDPMVYSDFLEDGDGVSLISLPDGSIAVGNMFTGENLFANGVNSVLALDGRKPKVYAPDNFASGSSIVHWDERTFRSGTTNSLMTPFFSRSESNFDVGDITRGHFRDIGWLLNPDVQFPTNTAPQITSSAIIRVDEGQLVAIDVETTDDSSSEGDGLRYDLTGDIDDDLFRIDRDTGVVTFIPAPDFENPADANGDNIYEIQVTVEDFGNFIDVQNITIEVIDIDDVPPGLVSLFPTPDSVDHPIGDNLTMTFTEPIAFGLGTIEIRKVLDDSTVESFDVQNASNIAIDGSVLSIDPTLNLFGGTQYYILVDAGAITDLSGVTFEGIPNSTIWGFTTEIDEATAFITTWSVGDTGSNARRVVINEYNNIFGYNFSVDWGDGTQDYNLTDGIVHTYENAGSYTIMIAGDYPWARFSTIGTLETVDQWGNMQWKSMERAFAGLPSVDVVATDTPNLSGVTSMAGMFANCDSLFGNSAFGNWDVSSIVDMSGVFVRTSFNQDISSWDVSSVIDMSEMFFSAFEFNQDIGSWDVSSVVDMARMFAHNSGTESDPPIFNQYIGGWDVSKVTDMSYMFSNAPAFNQDIGGWNVAAVTNMEYMFNHATAFNQNLNNWNVSAVENMKAMFFEATSFNSPLSNWNPSAVIDMSSMFEGATAFNQNLDGFNIPRVENLSRMFALATSFNGQLSAWNTVSVTDMGGMFQGATAFNQNLDSWNVSSVTSMDKMFLGATSFNGDIGNWDVSNVKDFLDMFADAVNFNQDLGNWNVGSAETMVSMFSGATNFNQNIGTWNVSNVSFMAGMFRNAISFDQNLSNWNVEKVISMSGMFDGVKLSTENYDSVLNSWAALNVQSGVRFDGGFSKYCEGEASRANLIDNRGWQITDGGEDCPDTVSTSIFISEYLDSTSFNKAIELFNPNDEAVDLSKFVLGRVSNGGSGIEGAILLTGLLPPKETYVIAHPNALSAILDKADLTSFTLFHDGNDAYILLKGTTDLTRSTVVDFFGTGDLSIPEINNPGDEWNDGNFGTRRVTLRRKPSVPFGNPKGFNPITTLSAEWNSVGISVFDGLGSHEFGFEEDNIPPELTCSEPIQVGQDEGVCDALVTLVDPTATDDISLPENITIEGTRSDGLSLSDAFPVGETTISWTATDEAGNSESCNQVVTVFDTEDPQIQTAIIGDPEFENSFEQCGAVIFYDTPTATDNCPGVLIEQTEGLASGSLFPIGETLNTYVATDAAGNTASFSFTIIVNDTEVPQAICQDIALELDQNGIAQIVPSDVDGGSTDNCGIASMEVSPSSFGINDVGENTVTLTITDEVGNSNTCEAIVTVNEFQRPFVTTWKTDNPGVSEDNQITIPTFPGETYDYTVDWGDGSTSENVTGDITHTYEFPGTYTVSISGDFPRIYFNNVVIGIPTLGDEEKILSVNQWGSIVWTSMLGAFAGCKNLDVLATDVPDLSNVFDMTGMFRFCESLIGNSSFNNWDVSNVTQMGNLFENAFIFNQNIGSWNVSNVTFMSDLFNNAASFNQDLSNWNVGRVEQMALTFGGASSFNQDIGNWNVSNVKEMLGMFAGATSFNQDISGWNMENVERTQAMFSGATAFNQDLSGWNVSNVTSFNVMFFGATAFDHDLGSWDVQRVSNMDEMFGDSGLSTSNYDNTLIGWAQLPNLQQNVPFGAGNSQFCLGEEARQLLIDDFGWNINDAGKVADCQRPFITTWITSNQGISDDNTIWIPTSPALGYDFTVNWGDGNFDFNVTGDVSHTYDNPGTYTVSISGIFGGIAFNSFPGNEANSDATKLVEVNQWGDIVWQSMTSAFAGCSNMDVVATDAPDLTNVDSLFSTFAYCSTMTGENSLRNWDVSTITDLTQTFYTCSNFNEDISGWDVRNVINMTNLFLICTSFDQDLSPWDVSNVRNMSGMFYGANVFEQPIGNWDVGQVENMRNMFAFAHSFNQDLSNWNVGNVLDMSYMFSFNDIFNQDIGNWDVANVQTMEGLFQNSVFDQDLSEWNVSMVGNMSFMFNNSGLSNENYDTILIGWSQLPSLQNGVTLDALLNQYCSAADARQSIIDTYGWTINDRGEATDCGVEQRPFVTTWKTDNPGISEDNQITIPTFPDETYDYTVDWGDGTTTENVTGDITHTYEAPGTYTVSISGEFPRIYFKRISPNSTLEKDYFKLISIEQWGDIEWTSMESAFSECINLDVKAVDIPNLSQVFDAGRMFFGCSNLIGNFSFGLWDVSNISNMSQMFDNNVNFNQDIGNWNTENVTDMNFMFYGASNFNQDISGWNVSNVINLATMFAAASSFNQSLADWNVQSVQNMNELFDGSGLSNENYDKTLIGWSQLPALQNGVQLDAPNNQYCLSKEARQSIIDTYGWTINDAGEAEDCSQPLIMTWFLNQPDREVIIPTHPDEIYDYTISWGDGTIETGLTGDARHTFLEAGNYTIKISGDFPRMYFGSLLPINEIPYEITQWGDIKWTSFERGFYNSSLAEISATDAPDLSQVTSMTSAFAFNRTLKNSNQSMNTWDVGNITDMSDLFAFTDLGDVSGLDNWNVSGVTNLVSLFAFSSFNGDIASWDVSSVKDMTAMFQGSSFDQDISTWDVSNVEKMDSMFDESRFSNENYDKILIGWSQLPSLQNGVTLDALQNQFCEGKEARQSIIDTYGWTINDAGEAEDCQRPFITMWDTRLPGGTDNLIVIGTHEDLIYNYNIDWGDGSSSINVVGDAVHRYETPGLYEVSINGTFPGINLGRSTLEKRRLIEIKQWGDIEWETFEQAFNGCLNMDVIARDIPDLTRVKSLANMFGGCVSLLGNTSFNNWDVSQITNMFGTFGFAQQFNQNIAAWDVSNVQDMTAMFAGLEIFNQDIGDWDVSSVISMFQMFDGASRFNQDISGWNVISVENMSLMFRDAISFNQDISGWNVSNNTRMRDMFAGAILFNQNLGDWNISQVVDAFRLFNNSGLSNENYDQTLIGWSQLPSLQNGVTLDALQNQYCEAKEARQLIIDTYGWTINDAGEAEDCEAVVDCPANLPNEDEAIVLPEGNSFLGIDEVLGTSLMTNDSDCALALVNNDAGQLFANYRIPIDLLTNGIQAGDELFISLDGNSSEGVARIELLRDNTPNQAELSHTYIGGWSTFSETIVVPENINSLDIWLYSNYLSNEPGTAYYDNLIVQNLSSEDRPFVTIWKTDNTGFTADNQIEIPTFPGETYNYTVDWGDGSTNEGVLGNITHTYEVPGTYTVSISGVFPRIFFNGQLDIDKDFSKILSIQQWGDIEWSSMRGAFDTCFNLSMDANDTPDLSNVSDLSAMFVSCALEDNPSFNNWNVSTVERMNGMFFASSFNSDISNWDVSNVTSMQEMFFFSDFNRDISNWDVGKLENMATMFSNSPFDQDISNWNISNVSVAFGMFNNSGFSNENYDNILIGWSQLTFLQNGVTLDAPQNQFCLGKDARQLIIDTYGWTFNDAGEAEGCIVVEDCPDDLPNEDSTIPLIGQGGFQGLDSFAGTSAQTNGSPCALMVTNNDVNQPFANYRIPIDLAAYGINPGDELFISLDGNSSEGVARIEVNQDNQPNTALASNTYLGGWSTFSETVVVPSGITTINLWLYSNYLSNAPGIAYYDNLIVTNLSEIDVPCPDDLPNEELSIPLVGQGGFQGLDSFTANSTITNDSPCALEVTNTDADQPFANYRIPIVLEDHGISPGDQLLISLDGNSLAGTARIEVNQDNSPNSALASNTYEGGWSTFSEIIVVPEGITSINLWLYSNYLNFDSGGTAYYDNLIVRNLGPLAVPATFDLNSLDLWPNPANETVNISFERPTEVVEFQIFDLMGRLIRTFKVDNRSSKFELPVYDLPVGAYFIKTMDENGQLYDEQMMIQR